MSELTPQAQEVFVARVRDNAQELAAALTEAVDAGVSQAVLLPELIAVLKESGLLGDSPLPFGFG
jgi:hypothetical protein